MPLVDGTKSHLAFKEVRDELYSPTDPDNIKSTEFTRDFIKVFAGGMLHTPRCAVRVTVPATRCRARAAALAATRATAHRGRAYRHAPRCFLHRARHMHRYVP
jgi:hypothetical protein